MQVSKSPRMLLFVAAAVCVAGAALVFGQENSTETLKSLNVGLPSSHALARAKPKVEKSTQRYAKSHPSIQPEIARIRETHRIRLASLQSLQGVTRISARSTGPAKAITRNTRKNSQKPPAVKVVPAQEIVKTPYQDMSLAFLNPRQEPVPKLNVVVTVHRKSAASPNGIEDVVWHSQDGAPFVTDDQGRVHLTKVGPLPVSIDVAFAGEDEKEWQVAKPDAASITVDMGSGVPKEKPGSRVAIYRRNPVGPLQARITEPARDTAPGHSLRLAGFAEPLQHTASRPKPAAHPVKPVQKFIDVLYDNPAPTTIPVEHNSVDVQVLTEAGSKLTSPAAPDQTWTADESGKAICKIPVAALTGGPIPIRIAKDRSGGESESVIPTYKTDPYDRDNVVKGPPLVLVRVRSVNLPGGFGVLDNTPEVERALGGNKRDATTGRDRAVGLERWRYADAGLDVLMRPWIDPDMPMLCERIVLTDRSAARVGGIGVGSNRREVLQALGEPAHSTVAGGDAYLAGGIRIFYAGDTVSELRIRRPTMLLKEGTTAFVPRPHTRLYIESFEGDPSTGITTREDLQAYLEQIHTVDIVQSKDDADLILNAKARFQDSKDHYIGMLPFQYSCSVKVDYELTNAATGKAIPRSENVQSQADYTEEVESDRDLIAVLLAPEKDRLKKLYLRDKKHQEERDSTLDGLFNLRDNMARAAQRCPIIASRRAYGGMVAEIGQESDYAVRVTDIDYETGSLTLNAGTAEGIHVSTPDKPYQFEICVGEKTLPYHEEGLSADYYTAVVTDTGEHTCTCQLRRRWRSVEKTVENDVEEAAPDAARFIPDPVTGVVSARAWLPNPKLDANLIVPEDRDYSDFVATLVGKETPQNRGDYASLRSYISTRPQLLVAFFDVPRGGRLAVDTPYVVRGRRSLPPAYNWQSVVRRNSAPAIRQPNGDRRESRIFMPRASIMAEIRDARRSGRRISPSIFTPAPAGMPCRSDAASQKRSDAAVQEARDRARAQRSLRHQDAGSDRPRQPGLGNDRPRFHPNDPGGKQTDPQPGPGRQPSRFPLPDGQKPDHPLNGPGRSRSDRVPDPGSKPRDRTPPTRERRGTRDPKKTDPPDKSKDKKDKDKKN